MSSRPIRQIGLVGLIGLISLIGLTAFAQPVEDRPLTPAEAVLASDAGIVCATVRQCYEAWQSADPSRALSALKENPEVVEEKFKKEPDKLKLLNGLNLDQVADKLRSAKTIEDAVAIAVEILNAAGKTGAKKAVEDALKSSIEVAKRAVQVAEEVGKVGSLNLDPEACSDLPDDATVAYIRACAKIARELIKYREVRKHISDEVVEDVEDEDAIVRFEKDLASGKASCGGYKTAEDCGSLYCFSNANLAVGVPPSDCRDIAVKYFGPEGLEELERAYREAGERGEEITLYLPEDFIKYNLDDDPTLPGKRAADKSRIFKNNDEMNRFFAEVNRRQSKRKPEPKPEPKSKPKFDIRCPVFAMGPLPSPLCYYEDGIMPLKVGNEEVQCSASKIVCPGDKNYLPPICPTVMPRRCQPGEEPVGGRCGPSCVEDIRPDNKKIEFPYIFSGPTHLPAGQRTVRTIFEARDFCENYGPGKSYGLGAECELVLAGVVLPPKPPGSENPRSCLSAKGYVEPYTIDTTDKRSFYYSLIPDALSGCGQWANFLTPAARTFCAAAGACSSATPPTPKPIDESEVRLNFKNCMSRNGWSLPINRDGRSYDSIAELEVLAAPLPAGDQLKFVINSCINVAFGGKPTPIPPTPIPTPAPEGQREIYWNNYGFRSYIRKDADPARIELIREACKFAPSWANVWLSKAGDYKSEDFGMADPEKCKLYKTPPGTSPGTSLGDVCSDPATNSSLPGSHNHYFNPATGLATCLGGNETDYALVRRGDAGQIQIDQRGACTATIPGCPGAVIGPGGPPPGGPAPTYPVYFRGGMVASNAAEAARVCGQMSPGSGPPATPNYIADQWTCSALGMAWGGGGGGPGPVPPHGSGGGGCPSGYHPEYSNIEGNVCFTDAGSHDKYLVVASDGKAGQITNCTDIPRSGCPGSIVTPPGTPAADCSRFMSQLPGSHYMAENPNYCFDGQMARYVNVSTGVFTPCTVTWLPGCVSGGNFQGGGSLPGSNCPADKPYPWSVLGGTCMSYDECTRAPGYPSGGLCLPSPSGGVSTAGGGPCSAGTTQALCNSYSVSGCYWDPSINTCRGGSAYTPPTGGSDTTSGSTCSVAITQATCFTSLGCSWNNNICTFTGTGGGSTASGSCPSNIASALGPGCHQMYTSPSGVIRYCNGGMDQHWDGPDSASSAGCSSFTASVYQPNLLAQIFHLLRNLLLR